MAFQFIPPFEEGDKQTNPETGIEYIFTDGAWRPLGPRIENQFDELDQRYVQKAGDTIHGKLEFDHGDDTPANLIIRPNVSDVSTSVYQLNGGALRFRSLPAEDTSDGSTTHIAMGKNDVDGSPETYIYHLQDPQDELWATNKRYVDEQIENISLSEEYLPLSGGDLTGNFGTKASGKHFSLAKTNGDVQFRIDPNSSDFFTNIYSYSNGGMRFRVVKGQSTLDGYGTSLVLKKLSQTIGSTALEYTTELNYLRTPTSGHHGANKQYVDDAIKEAIADIIGSDGDAETPAPLLRPALLSWIYEGEDSPDAVTPSSGKFRLHTSSSGNKFLRFSFNSYNGCKIGDGKFDDTNVSFDYGPVGTIWEWMDGSVAKFKLKRQFRISAWRWNYQLNPSDSRHFEFKLSTSTGHNWSALTTGTEYFINVGGFF